MAIPDIIKQKANDIRTKVYGREVRESLARGIEVAGDIADNADTKADDAVDQVNNIQGQVDQLVIEGDSSVEAAQARVKEDGTEFDTLRDRLNNSDERLADIAINVKTLGAVGDGISNDADVILDATVSGRKIFFPDGIYRIDNNLLFEDIEDVTWEFSNEAILLDSCGVEVLLEGNEGTSKSPYGIKFSNCKNIKIINMKHDSFPDGGFRIQKIENVELRVPQIDFDNCMGLEIVDLNILGVVGPYVGIEPDNNDPADAMASSYTRFSGCEKVSLKSCELSNNGGSGEIFSFSRCSSIIAEDFRHEQEEGSRTFWSLANIIDCNNVMIRDILKIKSNSTGSLIDVCGNNIILENIHPDYPNGACVVDVTAEWQHLNSDSENIYIRNVSTNSDRGIVRNEYSSVSGTAAEVEIDGLYIENIFYRGVDPDPEVSNHFYNRMTKNTFIKNVNLKDIKYFISTIQTQGESSEYFRNVFVDQSVFEVTNAEVDTMSIETFGRLEIKDSRFRGNKKYGFWLRDRYGFYKEDLRENLEDSPSLIVMRNCEFFESHVVITSNVVFDNCTFYNCSFETRLTGGIGYFPYISFVECEINISNDDEGLTFNRTVFNFSVGRKVTFSQTKVIGKHENSGGHRFLQIPYQQEIKILGSVFDVERYNDGVKQNKESFNLLFFQNNHSGYAEAIIENSEIHGIAVQLDGTQNTGSLKNKILINNTYFVNEEDAVRMSVRSFPSDYNTGTELKITNSRFNDQTISLLPSNFRELVNEYNVESY